MGWEMGLEPTTTGITILDLCVKNQIDGMDFEKQKRLRP